MRATRRLNPVPFLLLVFSALLALCAWLAGGPTEVLGILPAILIAFALAFERYPGEQLIERLARRLRRPRAAATAAAPPSRWALDSTGRALLLLAGSRRLRGPPQLV